MIILPGNSIATPAFHSSTPSSERFPFVVDKLIDNRINSPHWHNFTQIWYTVSGEYYHTINGERRKQTAGSVALVFPFAIHEIDSIASDLSETNVISVSIYADLSAINQAPFIPLTYSHGSFGNLFLPSFLTLSGKEKELADKLIENSLSEYNLQLDMDVGKIAKKVSMFLETCAGSINTIIPARKLAKTREEAAVIRKAVNILHSSNLQDISLDSVCNYVFMSKRSFTEKFKRVSGRTFGAYSKAVRLHKAIYSLRYSQKSIAEISKECGYASASHFINECREVYNSSPKMLKSEMIKFDRTYGEYLHSLNVKKNAWREGWSESDKYEYKMYALGLI